jgi:hypothetical protein
MGAAPGRLHLWKPLGGLHIISICCRTIVPARISHKVRVDGEDRAPLMPSPEAQRLLAPRFSVGAGEKETLSPVGTMQMGQPGAAPSRRDSEFFCWLDSPR